MALKDIESVEQDENGRIKIAIPHRKDSNIPLESNESKKFIDKPKELILAKKEGDRTHVSAGQTESAQTSEGIES